MQMVYFSLTKKCFDDLHVENCWKPQQTFFFFFKVMLLSIICQVDTDNLISRI